eukprot:9730406-Lingulodinium_polyedra.AAC.1
MDNPRAVHGLSMDLGQYVDCPWTVHGQLMDNPWSDHGQSMDCRWTVHVLVMDYRGLPMGSPWATDG